MTNTLNYQENNSIYQPYFLLESTFNFEKDVPRNDISRTVIEVMEGINLGKIIDFTSQDAREYDPVMMLTLIVLCYAEEGKMSLRQLEKKCMFDNRYRTIAKNKTPSYKSFSRFINKRLKLSIDELFKVIYQYVESKEEYLESILYIDGTKFEANANKMTFCWKAWSRRYEPRHWKKCMDIIMRVNTFFKKEGLDVRYSILKKPDIEYLIKIDEALENYIQAKSYVRKRKGKHELSKLCDELKESAKKMWQYAIQNDILGERNSFSKTDCDATFMHMKYDYYNNTNVFKPGYNVQIGVQNQYISHLYISSDSNDVKTLQPFLNGYKKQYGVYPEVVVGDAGYGSYENYMYCKKNNIEAALKYSGYEKMKEKINDKNRFYSRHFTRSENGTPVCAEGHEFTLNKTKVTVKSGMVKVSEYYHNEHCAECPFRTSCTKSKNGRTVQITRALDKEHKRIDELYESERGKELKRNRSWQAEGAFADIKNSFQYSRLQRRGESGVKVEISLIAIGFNLRKYHNKKIEKSNSLSKVN